MFVQESRNFVSSTSNFTTNQTRIDFDNDKIKINKFDIYREDRNKLNNWLTQVDVYFAFNHVFKSKKTLFASIFFKDKVEAWLKSQLRKYLDDDENDTKIFANYDKFKKEIRRIFEIVNEKFTTKRNFQHITQRIATIEYAIKFQEEVEKIEWNDATKMIMYRKDLKKSIKNELMRYDDEIDNLNRLIEASIELDDKLYDRAMKKRNLISHERFDIYEVFEKSYRAQKSNYDKRNNNYSKDYYESMSMKLNLTKRRKEKNLKKKQNNKTKACYTCEKINHFARDCRFKKLMFQRQINATLRKELEAKTNWKKIMHQENFMNISKVNSNDENYCLIDNSNKVLTMLEKTTLRSIAITKSSNFNNNNIVAKRSRTSYSSKNYSRAITSSKENYEWDEKFEKRFKKIAKKLKKETILNQNDLKRIVNNVIDQEKTMNSHDLLNWTTCYNDYCETHRIDKKRIEWFSKKRSSSQDDDDDSYECSHDEWKTCQNWKCEKHIVNQVEKLKVTRDHEILDWSFCENVNCSYHREKQHFDTLTRIKKKFMTSIENETKLKLIVKKRLNFSIKNISKECNITTQKKQLNLISITRESSTTINVSKQRFVLMIDSSAKKKTNLWKKLIEKSFLRNYINTNMTWKL